MRPNRAARQIVIPYVVLAGLWIVFSDKFLQSVVSDRKLLTDLSIAKGWAFVAVTGLMLYALIYRLGSRLKRAHEMEETYRQAQKMESIGRLAGGVAHDFNNILTSIFGNVDMALSELPCDHPVRGNIEECRKEAERAASLTRQLLAFARRQLVESKVLNLNEVTANLLKMLTRLIGENIKLTTETAANLNPIKADPSQIEQVLLNLVVNARDAMPQGGVLTIRTANVTLTEKQARQQVEVAAGEYVMLSVSDNGTGMSLEAQEHVFEPFFTTKNRDKGTGLGLATCFGIVRQNRGIISFVTRPGLGTTFQVLFPRAQEETTSVPRGNEKVEPLRGNETVLLVEDDTSLRHLVALMLRRQGYKVLDAANGREAIEFANKSRAEIDLLVADIIMPEVSGRVVAEEMTRLCPNIKIIFMSGYLDEEIVDTAGTIPGAHFLQKPFTSSDLAKKVRAVLEGHQKSVMRDSRSTASLVP